MQNELGSAQPFMAFIANATTHFDGLCRDTLSIIAKQTNILLQKACYASTSKLSDSESEDSKRYMPKTPESLRFLALLFAENSPFRDAAATLVSTIEISWSPPGTYIESFRSVLVIGPGLFKGEAKEMQLARTILSACGPYVRKIDVRGVPRNQENPNEFAEQFTTHVFQYCRNVEEISFTRYEAPLTKWGIASAFLHEYGANLREIELEGESDEEGFTDFQKCVMLKRLKSDNLNTAALISLLNASASTLEELDIVITSIGDSVQVMEAIRNNCKQLSLLDIRNLQYVIDIVGQESYSSLICSYGSRLKSANIFGLGQQNLVEVVKACTNLEITVFCVSDARVDCQSVCDLGLRVAILILDHNDLHRQDYPRALERCSNLRHLDLSGRYDGGSMGVTDEMIANVFSPFRFPKLEHLSVPNFYANERNMALIASCTANLKSASFVPFDYDSKASGFQFIARSNKHLKDILINLYDGPGVNRRTESALEWASELVKIFRKCRKLRFELSRSFEEEVKKEDLMRICKVLPCRDVDVCVRIDNVRYQYPQPIPWVWA